jgi:hypothetical protein
VLVEATVANRCRNNASIQTAVASAEPLACFAGVGISVALLLTAPCLQPAVSNSSACAQAADNTATHGVDLAA